MSTLEDFKNAPIGTTATSPNGNIAFKTGKSMFEWTVYGPLGRMCDSLSSDEMVGYTLNHPAPPTAREALGLAWDLAHPVKEGQVIPVGTWLVERRGDRLAVGKNDYFDATANDWDVKNRRTLEPLPEPLPEWLDAPAILAGMDECSWQKVWLPKSGGRWECTCCGAERHWSELEDVTPLYPKEDA